MSTVRSADEVRPAEFGPSCESEIDPDMVAIAESIIDRRSGEFDPTSFRDRYQDALRELVAQKTKGKGVAPREVAEPPKVINLMDALKRSLVQEEKEPAPAPARARPNRPARLRLRPAPESVAPAGFGRAEEKRGSGGGGGPGPPGVAKPERAFTREAPQQASRRGEGGGPRSGSVAEFTPAHWRHRLGSRKIFAVNSAERPMAERPLRPPAIMPAGPQ